MQSYQIMNFNFLKLLDPKFDIKLLRLSNIWFPLKSFVYCWNLVQRSTACLYPWLLRYRWQVSAKNIDIMQSQYIICFIYCWVSPESMSYKILVSLNNVNCRSLFLCFCNGLLSSSLVCWLIWCWNFVLKQASETNWGKQDQEWCQLFNWWSACCSLSELSICF